MVQFLPSLPPCCYSSSLLLSSRLPCPLHGAALKFSSCVFCILMYAVGHLFNISWGLLKKHRVLSCNYCVLFLCSHLKNSVLSRTLILERNVRGLVAGSVKYLEVEEICFRLWGRGRQPSPLFEPLSIDRFTRHVPWYHSG